MTPTWAVRVVADVCESAGVAVPSVTWRRSRESNGSSGRYFPTEVRIVVTAGSSRTDQRLVLLHELAHHLNPGDGHSPAFWRSAWGLYRRHRLLAYALRREATKATAMSVAVDLGIRGARAAAVAGSDRRRRKTPPRGVCPMPESEAAAHGYATPHTHYVGTVHRFTHDDGSFIDYWTERR